MLAGRTTGSGGRGILCPQCVAQGYVWFWCCHSRLSWCVVTYYMSWMYMFRAAIVCVIVCHLFIHLPLCRVKCGELRLCLVLPLRVSMFVVCVNCFSFLPVVALPLPTCVWRCHCAMSVSWFIVSCCARHCSTGAVQLTSDCLNPVRRGIIFLSLAISRLNWAMYCIREQVFSHLPLSAPSRATAAALLPSERQPSTTEAPDLRH